jgi:asparagine synthase (glutamine-hydrolysing)
MCGIAGICERVGSQPGLLAQVKVMASTLAHRGPDDDGSMGDELAAFGFRRLKIIDLAGGHQPIASEDGAVWIMLNGEVYNYIELREQLRARGRVFRTRSDTEVALQAYLEYGDEFVTHLRGMFAIAIWDRRDRRLVLVRDRLGKKPLFYTEQNGRLYFASELKALLACPQISRRVDAEALHDYLSQLCVPSPRSIICGVRKLPPAHLLIVEFGKPLAAPRRYWRASALPRAGRGVDDFCDELRTKVAEAVRLRTRSDVPFGAFLSGGIDSTIITGLLRREVGELDAFTIGFDDPHYDESAHAVRAARHIGVRHHIAEYRPGDMSPDELGRLAYFMDEPFADSSFLPTYMVSKLARQKVTVVLTGDGGDELFGGYVHYLNFARLQRAARAPAWCLRAGRALCGAAHARGLAPRESWRRAEKFLRLAALTPAGQMRALTSYFGEAEKRELYAPAWRDRLAGHVTESWDDYGDTTHSGIHSLDAFMLRSLETSMVDDILTKVDRATMANSLEARCPFLDHEVVELAMSIPHQFKLRNGELKWILKRAFGDLFPPGMDQRRKQGFELPFAVWFRRPEWRELLLGLLAPDRLRAQGIFDPNSVVRLRDEFLARPDGAGLGISAYQLRHRVWLLLMFQMWYNGVFSPQGAARN